VYAHAITRGGSGIGFRIELAWFRAIATALRGDVRQLGCNGRVLRIAVPEVVLHRSQVRAPISEVVAAGM
jgi:hypothetical protein